ncbi:SDR family oxidoreductase [Pseudoteredinibacter isoporae]|uniref:Peroxisomal trans-2-enoyl-CoA reductase n=1 Tax=Pseudoteredinibacter isoporae TaxID=570281 RepID=A0A7X0JTD3_9GAMM|nr:SDR family oxidoreductase [Pseudoteredinibacter isoporae]MBB6521363.1 citronellol/citronellal dehydrogenase [Pseudoteredinibacter isoporae]NHO86918.1 SDR family oxidoreductase [Pseudoteredinibacter isoporae]NIB24630.1 SDR family oxidoreductase [Pseudoteredinibacter isoporae]
MSYQSTLAAGSFAGKTIVVTGGGSGIGRCTAHELSSLGAKVVLLGRSIDKLENTAAEIKADGGQVECHSIDIRDEEKVTEVIADILKNNERIHGLVNNAGGQFPSPLEAISQKGFETVVRSNLVGGFLMARELYKQHFQEHGGNIVNITADNLNGMPGMGHSGAARAGMENFTKTAAWEWGRYGVRVNAVAPGWVASSGFDTYPDWMKESIRNLKNHVPLGRIASEAEIASVLCFLLSEGANFISGQILRVDGAASMGSAPALFPLPPGKVENTDTYNGFHRAELPDVLKN